MASFNFYLSRHQNLYLQINLKKRLITIFLLVFFLVIPCGGFMPAYAAIPKIVAGDNHTIAIKADGTLWAWGYNPYGELGNGSNDGSAHPVPTRVGIDNRWTAVAIGSWHTIAQKADATLWAWGGNSSSQLSLSADNITYNMDSNAHPNPIQIRMDANWIAVAAQLNRTFAQKTDGTLWGWGDNHYGALGTGSIVNSATPIPAQIGTDANWAGVSAGENHTFAQKTDGTLWAWGYNSYGQLGIGSADTSAHPIPVQTVTDATWLSVAAGGVHTIALKTDGTLWAWGGNSYCQLGISSTDTNAHPSPVQIGTDANWLSVAAGGVHTIALKTDGTLWAWGDNRYGQLGIGSAETNTQPSPVQIGTDTDWATIAVGGFNSFALKTDGTLWAWGRNNYGQLGDGTTLDQIAPVKIMELNHNDLIVKKAGTGSGSVTGSGTYDYGTTQIITASADTGSTFTGWSGNCTGATSQIDVLVDGDKICTATFTLNQYDLTVNNAGNGSGKITGAGTYDYGSTQMLIATADTGSTFTGWSGSCSGTERVVGVLIGGNVNCTATFTLKQFILTVDKKGTGSGLVTGSGTYDYGTTQIVNATANTGSTFTGWGGNCSGAKPCNFSYTPVYLYSYSAGDSRRCCFFSVHRNLESLT